MKNGLPELIAPAGGMEQLKVAVRFGADAVYLGGSRFGLRAFADNFSEDELREAIAYAHAHEVKVFVTVNAFMTNREMDVLGEYLAFLQDVGADAVIMADPGAVALARKFAPLLEVHISTQANVSNYQSALFWYEQGARQIVLSRELTLEEIAEIRQRIPSDLALETFVHGAMCLSVSGRCWLSAYINARSGNRGQCTQPCRWRYRLEEESRPGEYYPVDEDRGAYILSSKDLNMLQHLSALAEAGVDALKIEGRMKTSYYVATVVNAYRQALSRLSQNSTEVTDLTQELQQLSNRGYTTGFYFGEDTNMQEHSASRLPGAYDFVGLVMGKEGDNILVEVRNKISVGDTLEALTPGKPPIAFAVESISDETGELAYANIPMRHVRIPCSLALEHFDILRKRATR